MTSQSLMGRRWRQRFGSEDTPTSDEETSSPKHIKPSHGHASPSPYSHENGGGGGNPAAGGSYGGAAAPGGKLAQEIHDEFLVCKICLEGYKNPKCLQCLHTFCEQCIESHVNSESTYKKYSDYREFTCPLCRKRTQLPVGGVKKLPDNFLVSSLTAVVSRQRPSQFPFCDICRTVARREREATSKCLDCAKLLCAACVQMHKETKVTSGHSLFDVEIEKDIECKEHKDEVVRFYCEPCDACICVLCTFNEHKDHEITQFTDAVVKYKKNIQRLLENCNGKIATFDEQVEALDQCEVIISAVQQRVHDTAIEFIQEVRTREKQLIEELENIYGKDCMERIVNKKSTSSQVENLRTTCSLTQVILAGKDIELLLLKRDVQDKLNSLNAVTIRALPSTIGKVVDFVAGTVDLGYINDHDRPLLSRMPRGRRSVAGGEVPEYYTGGSGDPPAPPSTVAGTQTDPEITKLEAPPLKPASDDDSTSSSSSDDDSDEDSDSDDDDDDEGDDKEKSGVDAGVQTEIPGAGFSSQATMTESASFEEKGVNTLAVIGNGSFVGGGASSLNGSTEDLSDNSLAARRRRRRERAHMGGYDNNGGTSFGGAGEGYENGGAASPGGGYQSRAASAYSTSRAGYQTSSVDDSYYEAPTIGGRASLTRH